MLLSMYLLYRFARSGRSWTYLVEIGLFVVLISLVSVLFPVYEIFFVFPLGYLSFPFYFWTGELAAPAALRNSYPWLSYHSIRFLTLNLNLTPDWVLSDGWILTGPQSHIGAVVFAFWVLFLANVLGGVIGYVVGRRFSFPDWGEVRWLMVGVAFVVLAFVSAFVVGSVFPTLVWSAAEPVLTSVFGFGVIVFEIAFVGFLVGLAERGRVASLMVLGGLVLVLAGGWFGQLVTVTGGWTLVVLGGVFYFAKATVDYVRISEAQARGGVESEAESEAESEGQSAIA